MEMTKKDDGTFDVEVMAYVEDQEQWIACAIEHNGLCTHSFTHPARPEVIFFTFNFENRTDLNAFAKKAL